MKTWLEHLFEEIGSAWRFRWAALAATFVVALAGWLLVFALPDRYEAVARIFVDTRTALKPALKGLTTDQEFDAQINFVRQSLLTGPQLEKIAVDTGVLPSNVTDERQRTRILNGLSERVTLAVTSAGNQGDERSTAGTMYSLRYLDDSRERSLKVVDTLLNTFVEQVLGGKRAGSQNAQKFLDAQIKDYAKRLAVAEDRLAAFKKQNVGLMPSEQGGYFAQLQTETDAAKKAETDLSIALSRRAELTKQLHSDTAVSAAGLPLVGGQGVRSGDTASQIREAQARLDELLQRFTDKHPDVIATRANLDDLKKRRAIEIDSLRRGDASAVASSGAANNPVYQSIQLELNRVDVEIAALRRQSAQHQATVADLRKRLNSAPQVEAEFQQLNRDYDVNKAEYTALVENYQKARLGEQADNAGSVRFEVVQPPVSPIEPTWPKRNLFLAMVWLLALGVGAATAFALHSLRPIVNSTRAISQFTGWTQLGAVGEAFPTRYSAVLRSHVRKFSAAAAGLVIALGVALLLNLAGARVSLHALKLLVKS